MSALAVFKSTLHTNLTRYGRSWGLWILLLVAPIGARLFVPREDGTTIVISIADQLPVMTSSVIGVCLGVVVSTLLLPVVYIYLRANTNRRQPWQVEDVSPASRVGIALGRFFADVTVLAGALAALTFAGAFLGWLILPSGSLNVVELSFALWVIAGPALMGVAAIRALFDAVPWLRGGLGDFVYFCIWIATLAIPAVQSTGQSGFAANMSDPVGFVRPLIYGSGLKDPDFAIGGAEVKAGRIPIDAMSGLLSPGYLPSRAAWAGIAIAVVGLAGLIQRPRRQRVRGRLSSRLDTLLAPGAPPAAEPDAPTAPRLAAPGLGLLAAEARLILAGRAIQILGVGVVIASALVADTHMALSLILLLLIFPLTSHAGRSEARGLRALTVAAPLGAWSRRAAFVGAGTAIAGLMTVPHALLHLAPSALATGIGLGAIATATASMLAAVSGSAFAPRIILLIAWYVYSAS